MQPKCGTKTKAAFALHPARERQLPTRVAWWHESRFKLPGLSESGTRSVVEAAFQLAEHYTRLDFYRTRYTANALIVVQLGPAEAFDGAGGVLAMADVVSLYESRQREIWFDPGESWRSLRATAAATYALPVTCHEIGHTLGFGHGPAGDGGLMQPYYDPLVTTPTAAEVARFFREYPELAAD